MLVRRVLRCWAEKQGLFEKHVPPSEQQREFLRNFDLGYGERRLRFVIAGLSAWYAHAGEAGYPGRDDLDSGKARLYGAIARLSGAMSGESFEPALAAAIQGTFAAERLKDFLLEHSLDGMLFADEHGAELDSLADGLRESLDRRLTGFTAALYRDLYEQTRGWHPDRRRALLVRYLGFPFWDVLLYPMQALSDIGERDRVEIVRMSPEDVRLLSPCEGESKVKGVARHHFGAFFSRPDRENDYLWGRLDAAEHLVRMVLGSAQDPSFERWCKRAFAAALDEEEQSLARVRPLVEHLRTQI
jgi:hypothetical protein